MGVRLVRFDRYGNSNNYSYDHNDLINRDMMNQHPIYAIIGLQEVLNILEDSINDINQYLLEHTTDVIEKTISDIEESIEDIYEQIRTHIIQDVRDTYSISMDYNKVKQILQANVKIHSDRTRDNALRVVADGLYVPSVTTRNTKSILWQESLIPADGYDQQEVFNSGMSISHHYTSWGNTFDENDCEGWSYDASTKRFIHSQNTESMAAFITQDFYDYYTHTVYITSTNSDDDVLGVIIGYILDEEGKPHTLSVIFDRQTIENSYSVWYDYSLPDQERLFTSGNGTLGTRPSGSAVGSWASSGGIAVQIYKEHEILEITASNWGTTTLNQNTKIHIDLFDYKWGKQFIDLVQYGYLTLSQAACYFRVDEFTTRTNPTKNTFLANVRVSADPQNEMSLKDDGLFAPKFNISSQQGNALLKKDDGYYVCAAISKDAANALEQRADGLYTRDYRNVRIVTKANHGFIVGDFIYYHPTSGYLKAKGIDNYDINIVGMVTTVIDVNTFEYQWSGFFPTALFNTTNGYTQGIPLYISETNPGKVTQKQPDISKAVGYPVENAGLIISIERGVQYNQEAKIGDMKTSANDYNVRSDGFIKIIADVDYKKSLIEKLLDTLTDEFKTSYMKIDDVSVQFINVFELYNAQNVPYGMNLFIKAF